jgi:hypothetical protein
MADDREANSTTILRETERLTGELEIDYRRNTVKFYPNRLSEFTLPLSPLDVEVVRSLTQISRSLGPPIVEQCRG